MNNYKAVVTSLYFSLGLLLVLPTYRPFLPFLLRMLILLLSLWTAFYLVNLLFKKIINKSFFIVQGITLLGGLSLLELCIHPIRYPEWLSHSIILLTSYSLLALVTILSFVKRIK